MRVVQPLVVVVHGDGEGLFGVVLADYVGVEVLFDVSWGGDSAEELVATGALSLFLPDDGGAELDARAANVYSVRPFDHGAGFSLFFAAETAYLSAAAGGAGSTFSCTCHDISPFVGCSGRLVT